MNLRQQQPTWIGVPTKRLVALFGWSLHCKISIGTSLLPFQTLS